jgi:hypothetical protein
LYNRQLLSGVGRKKKGQKETKKNNRSSKRGFNPHVVMRSIFIGISIINTLVVLALLVYFPFVFLNLVFTNDYLTVSDVPYYNPDKSESITERYHFHWYLIGSDVLRIALPILPLFTMANLLIDGPSSMIWYTIIFFILVSIEATKFFLYSYYLVFCEDFQFCRNINPDEDSNKPNVTFIVMYAYSIGFALLTILYIFLGGQINKGRKYHEQRLQWMNYRNNGGWASNPHIQEQQIQIQQLNQQLQQQLYSPQTPLHNQNRQQQQHHNDQVTTPLISDKETRAKILKAIEYANKKNTSKLEDDDSENEYEVIVKSTSEPLSNNPVKVMRHIIPSKIKGGNKRK